MACIWKEEATKIGPYAIVWTVKKYKLVPVVVGHIPREILRFTKFCLNYGGRIKVKVFSLQYTPCAVPSRGFEILLFVNFLISKEKSAIIKHQQNLIDLNYKELTSMQYTPK